jgi:hypothetical protein
MAGRPVGYPKSGGRAKGTPNKRRSIEDLCAAAEFDPFEAMLLIAKSHQDDNLRFAAMKELCQYISPKLKALEHSGSIERPLRDLPDEELLALVPEAIETLKNETG